MRKAGFTMVELLIIVVVIAILAAITIVAYTGVTNQASESAVKSELRDVATKVMAFKAQNDSYPASLAQAGVVGIKEESKSIYYGGNKLFCAEYTARTGKVYNVNNSGQLNDGSCTPELSANCITPLSNTTAGPIAIYTHEQNDPARPRCPRAFSFPSVINGNPLTKLSGIVCLDGAVSQCLESDGSLVELMVRVPDSVTTLGGMAMGVQVGSAYLPDSINEIPGSFSTGGSLRSIKIPDSVVTIGMFAFMMNKLTEITFPQSVTTIGPSSFGYNKLTSLTLPDSITSIGSESFVFNEISTLTLSNGLTSIPHRAFADNKLKSVTVPSSVVTIDRSAFYNNQLTSITIPSSVTSIGAAAFRGNNLTSVSIPSGTTIDTTVHNSSFDPGVIINRY